MVDKNMNHSDNEERTYKSKGMLYGVASGSIIGAIITRLTDITALPICISVGLLLGLAIGSKIKKNKSNKGQTDMESNNLHILDVNGKEYRVIRLLGKGKGGYSYLVTDGCNEYVLKQIHHEPCDYYQFGDKLQSELRDYQRLLEIGIPMPRLIEVDEPQERLLKEYIAGDTIMDLVKADRMEQDYFRQIKAMCELLYAHGTNIDYFPTNFVVQRGALYYIDYECNAYMDEWNFENWGAKYWSRTPEFEEYLITH